MTCPNPRLSAVALLAANLAFVASTPGADGESPRPTEGAAVAELPAPAPDAPPASERNARHDDNVASALVLLLGGVVMMAVLAFATILIWGRRVRRTIRTPPAQTKVQDELWYLKPKAGLPKEDPPKTS